MQILIFLLALPPALLSLYIAVKKTTLCNGAVLFGIPIVVNGIDVFASGNLTTFREVAFAVWSLSALYVALNKKNQH